MADDDDELELWPFFTARARSRAPQILSYAAAGGAAVLVAPNGKVVMTRGDIAGLDIERVARVVSGASEPRRAFRVGSACVHAAPITAGWVLCAISTIHQPDEIRKRLLRASAVMAMALVDGGAGRPDGGSAPPGGGATAQRIGILLELARRLGAS